MSRALVGNVCLYVCVCVCLCVCVWEIKLMGMQKKKELEGPGLDLESIVQDQGKVRVRLDCSKHVLVADERVARGQDGTRDGVPSRV